MREEKSTAVVSEKKGIQYLVNKQKEQEYKAEINIKKRKEKELHSQINLVPTKKKSKNNGKEKK